MPPFTKQLAGSKKYKSHDSTIHHRNWGFCLYRLCIAETGKILNREQRKSETGGCVYHLHVVRFSNARDCLLQNQYPNQVLKKKK